MHLAKLKKTMKAFSCALAITIVLTNVAGVTAKAAGTTAKSETSSSETTSEQAPAGDPPSGDPPSGDAPSGDAPSGDAPSGGGGGANTMTFDYSGTYSGALTADGEEVTSDSETYTASTADQNAALVQNAGKLTITNGTFEKSGDDTDGDNCNFYGLNSILLSVNEDSTAYISDSTLNATSEGSNALFATDSATIYANNDTITTSADNSRGLDATYDGTIIANQMNISTKGDHCATIATDRGGGNISVTNSTLATEGSGSPLLYSTGDIEVNYVTGTSTGSQLAGMEGLNTILIYNSTLTSENTTATASDPMADGIIIYQSTSGDAESTTGDSARFEASNSTLKSAIESGAMFYITNTSANVVLSGTTLDFDSTKANLLAVQGNDANSWGTAGSNGATVTFTGLGETLSGNVDVDTISSLDMYLLENTVYTGSTSISENAVNTNKTDAPLTMNIDASSKWIVTGDATVTNLNAESGASIVDAEGNTVSIVANGSEVVTGTSSYTITVTGTYSNTVTTDEDNQLSSSFIDRSDFDSYYGTTTSFETMTASSTATSATEETITTAAEPQTTEVTETSSESTGAPWAYGLAVVVILAAGGTGFWLVRKKKK